MVSILGDYSYTFPKPIPLKLKLKDLLEDNVDEKYYLSDKMINCFLSDKSGGYPRKERFQQSLDRVNKNDIANTITTLEGNRDISTFIKDTENYIEWADGKNIQMNCRAWKDDKVVATLNTGGETKILIKNATKKGYLEAEAGDGIDISSRMEYHRGTVQKGKTQTLTTSGGENNGVVVVDTLKRDLCNKLIQDGLVEEGDVVKHSYTQQILDGNKKCVEKNDGNMITLTTRGDCVGVCVGTYQYTKSDTFMHGKDRLQLGKEVSDTLQTTQKEGVVTIGNYSKSNHNASRVVDQEHSAPTVMENHGTVTATQPNDIVLDCFCGSGTTCIACKETGRRYIGMEIDKEYHRIAVNRLNGINANGQQSIFTDFDE